MVGYLGQGMLDYLEQGRTINNGAYYAGELRRLHQEITRMRRGKLARGVLFLRLNLDLKSFLIPHILLIWLLLTFICSQNKNHISVVHSMEAMKAP